MDNEDFLPKDYKEVKVKQAPHRVTQEEIDEMERAYNTPQQVKLTNKMLKKYGN